MKGTRALTAIAGVCCLSSAVTLQTAHAQTVDVTKSGSETLFSFRFVGPNSSVTGVSPSFDVAAGKVFEININAICPGSRTVEVTVLNGSLEHGENLNSGITVQGETAQFGPVVGFQASKGAIAFSVDCDVVNFTGPIQVLALGRVVGEEDRR